MLETPKGSARSGQTVQLCLRTEGPLDVLSARRARCALRHLHYTCGRLTPPPPRAPCGWNTMRPEHLILDHYASATEYPPGHCAAGTATQRRQTTACGTMPPMPPRGQCCATATPEAPSQHSKGGSIFCQCGVGLPHCGMLHHCGTHPQPDTASELLSLFPATCSDGQQNGDETGVDCGGSCSACGMQCWAVVWCGEVSICPLSKARQYHCLAKNRWTLMTTAGR